MKNTTMLALVLIIIVGAGIFVFAKGNIKESISQESAEGSKIQEITLSMKNYNYYPSTIKVKQGIPVRISLDKSVAGCYRSFTIKEFGIAKNLRTPEDYIEFVPNKKGTFTFACSMNMGRGKLIVE